MKLTIEPTLRQDTPTGEIETWYYLKDDDEILACYDTEKAAETRRASYQAWWDKRYAEIEALNKRRKS